MQYSLELGRRGYRLRPFSSAAHPSIPECVAALRRIDALWKEPRFKKLNDKPIPLSYEGWENRWSPYANYIFSAPRQETDDPSLPETYDRVDCVDLEELLDGNATIPKLKSFRFGFAFTNWAHDIHRDLIILVDEWVFSTTFMYFILNLNSNAFYSLLGPAQILRYTSCPLVIRSLTLFPYKIRSFLIVPKIATSTKIGA